MRRLSATILMACVPAPAGERAGIRRPPQPRDREAGRGQDGLRPDQYRRPVAGQRARDGAGAGRLRLRRHGAQPARLSRRWTIFLPGMTDKAAIVAKKGAAAERRAVRAVSARSRPVAVGRQAGAGHRADGRDLQRRRHEGAGGDRGADDAVSADAGSAAPRSRSASAAIRPRRRSFAWGVSAAEYERRADVWPLNPDGDLLAVDHDRVGRRPRERRRRSPRVPGVGALFLGAGSDLSRSMGVPRQLAGGRGRLSAGPEGVQGAQGGVRHHRRQRERRRAPREGRLEHHPVDGARDHAGARAARRPLDKRGA